MPRAVTPAYKTLLALLSERQLKTLQQHGWIEIFGSKKIYRINTVNREIVGNVVIYCPGEPSGQTRCAHQRFNGPDWDPWQTYLSQYLMISTSKQEWLAVSHSYYSYYRVPLPTNKIP